jgi:transposase, IS5 family
MRPRERRETSEQDLFRSRPGARLALSGGEVRGGVTDKPGQPALPTRLMAGLAILKHTYDLSVRSLGAEPYFQHFCGEEFFQTCVGV